MSAQAKLAVLYFLRVITQRELVELSLTVNHEDDKTRRQKHHEGHLEVRLKKKKVQ
jgi:hypothetical protein